MSDTPSWSTTAPALAARTPDDPSQPAQPNQGAHDALHAGTRLDEFEVLSVLGAGGFGIVYLALDHVLMRQVAIKEYMPAALAGRGQGTTVSLRSASLADTFAAGLASFFNEARMLASFDHPSLVKVHRFWKANGTAYMAMPYYPGRTLKEVRAAMTGPPDAAWLRSVVEPLLGALELLHRQDVFHRDIAPDNILLLPDGQPVLLDFGSARRVIGDRTQALTAILKPNFAPLEQYADEAGMRQGPWTDLYALGATVHFMLTGQAPPPAVLRAVRDAMPTLAGTTSPAAPDAVPYPGVAPHFLATIDWTLALSPDDRPQDVAAVRQALSGALQPPLPTPRHPPASAVAGAGAAIHAVSPRDITASAVDIPLGDVDVGAPVAPSARKPARVVRVALALGALALVGAGSWWAWPNASPAATAGDSDLATVMAAPPAGAASVVVAPVGLAARVADTGMLPDELRDEPAAPVRAAVSAQPTPAALARPVATAASSAMRAVPTPLSTSPSTAAPAPAPAFSATATGASPPRFSAPTTAAAPRRPAVEAGSRSVRELCGERNVFSLAVCVNRECGSPRWRADPLCVESRRADEQRQRRMEQ